MSISLKNFALKFLRQTKWADFLDIISTSCNELWDEKINTFLDHIKKETATRDDFIEIIKMLGYPINLNYYYNLEYVKRMALTLTERIKYKTTNNAYKQLFYSLLINGYVYPLVENVNNNLVPLFNYEEIVDIKQYLANLDPADRFQLTKHIDVRISPKYVEDWITDYYLTRPLHHYTLNELSGTLCIDSGTLPVFATHNLSNTDMGKTSIIADSTCYEFNGTTHYIDSNYNSNYTNKSITLWAKKSSSSDHKVLFGSIDDSTHKFFLGFTDSGYMGAGIGTITWSNQFNILSIIPDWDPMDWHWYVLDFNNTLGVTRLYVDNQYIGYIIGSINLSIIDYFIGCLNNNGTPQYFFDGFIDDFRIYNYNISTTMRSDLWNTGLGREDDLLKTGDLKQFFIGNSLNILQYEVERIKEEPEVPHYKTLVELYGDESGNLKQYNVYDIDGQILTDIHIETITTVGWLRVDSFFLDTINPNTSELFRLDEDIPWRLDTKKENWLDEIYSVQIGQALGVTVTNSMLTLENSVYEQILTTDNKFETFTGGVNNTGQYIIDTDLGTLRNINWLTEVGLFSTTGQLIYYAKLPRYNKNLDFHYIIRITIDKAP